MGTKSSAPMYSGLVRVRHKLNVVGASGAATLKNGISVEVTRFRGHPSIAFEESTMSKTRRCYAPEFRRQMVELVSSH